MINSDNKVEIMDLQIPIKKLDFYFYYLSRGISDVLRNLNVNAKTYTNEIK